MVSVVRLLDSGGGAHVEFAVEVGVVPPPHVFEGGEFDLFDGAPRGAFAPDLHGWPGKAELLQAAAARAGMQEKIVAPPATGTLRGDVVALLPQANRARAQLGV